MEQLLTAIGVTFALFLVLAAAVEMILESFRGVLERIGVTWLKSKVSLDDALRISTEFVPESSQAAAKISALIATAEKSNRVAQQKINALKVLQDDLVKIISTAQPAGAPGAPAPGAPAPAAPFLPTDLLDRLNSEVASVREALSASESARVFWLRVISAAIGLFLAKQTDFNAFGSALNATNLSITAEMKAWLDQVDWIITGLAAAGGSSYWHDQLDKVRSLKSAYAQGAKLAG